MIVNDLSSSEEDDVVNDEQPSLGLNVNSFDISQTFELNQDIPIAIKTAEVPLANQILELDVSGIYDGHQNMSNLNQSNINNHGNSLEMQK